MKILFELGKLINNFTPYNYDLITDNKTPITPKPKYYFGKLKEEQAFYIFETVAKGLNQTKGMTRLQVIYKHKEKSAGFGMTEARNVIKDLKDYLEIQGFSYDSSFFYVGTQNDFHIYTLNLTTNEN